MLTYGAGGDRAKSTTGEKARLRRRRERRAAESSEERETRLAKRRVADRARYADRRSERRRERRAAESSEQWKTRLARRRVADRATVPQTIRFQNSLLCLLSFYGNMMHAISMYYIPK